MTATARGPHGSHAEPRGHFIHRQRFKSFQGPPPITCAPSGCSGIYFLGPSDRGGPRSLAPPPPTHTKRLRTNTAALSNLFSVLSVFCFSHSENGLWLELGLILPNFMVSESFAWHRSITTKALTHFRNGTQAQVKNPTNRKLENQQARHIV